MQESKRARILTAVIFTLMFWSLFVIGWQDIELTGTQLICSVAGCKTYLGVVLGSGCMAVLSTLGLLVELIRKK